MDRELPRDKIKSLFNYSSGLLLQPYINTAEDVVRDDLFPQKEPRKKIEYGLAGKRGGRREPQRVYHFPT